MSGHAIDFVNIDICDPANDEEREFMQANSTPNAKGSIVVPQIFNETEYCGVRV